MSKEEARKDNKPEAEEELDEVDKALKEKLEILVARLADRETAQQANAIKLIKVEITGATVSMTSVPKPLKFLTPLYADIKKAFETFPEGELKEQFSDIVSVIGMVASEEEDSGDALKYCLTGTRTELVTWGHEYLRALAGQIGAEYERLIEEAKNTDDLLKLVD